MVQAGDGSLVSGRSGFAGVTVILPVVTETGSLDETARLLKESCDGDIVDVLVVVCDRTTAASLARCQSLGSTFGERVRIHRQRLPYLGGAMREAFDLASGSHVLMMASDLETDPRTAAALIASARANPDAVITASRWATGGGFDGYGAVRVALNWLFQRLTSLIYSVRLTDATFGYRLFPTALVQSIEWEGLGHDFLLETVLKPVRLGIEVIEVPTRWIPRPDGESQNSLRNQLRYFKPLLTNRFQAPARMWRAAAKEPLG